MFEYNGKYLKIYGFKNIENVDSKRVNFMYKDKRIIVNGSNINVINLIDKSCDIEGFIDSVEMESSNG